jgi:putative lipase involved disintegration of autophagic bodies
MAMTTLDYAYICENVKSLRPTRGFSPKLFMYSSGFLRNGFAGAIYSNDEDAVVCFKGTGNCKIDEDEIGSSEPNKTIVQDLLADLSLAIGIIPNQAESARELMKEASREYGHLNLTVTGHSLGGYLAQVVSYWAKVPCVTFNAPGAWGDLQKSKINLFDPQIMWRGIKSTFKKEEVCVNFMHVGDIVGNYGLHRGRTNRLAGIGHGMKGIRRQ